MKLPCKLLATTLLAGAVFSAALPAAQAADFMPIYAKPTAEFPFTDVPVDRKEGIEYVYGEKIMSGIKSDLFGFGYQIKRVDAAVALYNALGLEPSNEKTTFKDLPSRAVTAVSTLQAEGIVNGKTSASFGANDPITRGEFAIMASRAYDGILKPAEAATAKFTDATGRYETAIYRLQASGITNGMTATTFGTSFRITRGDFAITLARIGLFANLVEEIPSSKDGIVIESDRTSYKMGEGVAYTITNNSENPVGTGYSFSLAKKFGGKWKPIRSNLYFPTVVEIINPGEKFKYSVILEQEYFRDPLTAGEYRVTHGVFPKADANPSKVKVAVYFTIPE
ncbi:S-layer homology domain-containing protein [Domibacillus indicus]|uniref:S-layer homology domain-containing protein n=1 Tax=Domibacillus indicus TaxID=1437523 RepID=UPI00203CAEDB|nr:S-layer homology domain-containing protein [Domibacillus indicus]MCM3788153.1 S-layer homology domain-containing protein [Domibacillus indicus]